MSLGGAEQAPDLEYFARERMQGILPYIAEAHIRLARQLEVFDNDTARLISPRYNTHTNLMYRKDVECWSAFCWEEADLSETGEFPQALEHFSDGFEVMITKSAKMLICGEGEDPHTSARPLRFAELVAVKDILWGAHLANPGYPKDYEDEQDEEQILAFQLAFEGFAILRSRAHVLDDTLRDFDGLTASRVVRPVSASAQPAQPTNSFFADGQFNGNELYAGAFFTPDDLLDEVPVTDRTANVQITSPEKLEFTDASGTEIRTASALFYFNQEDSEVVMAPIELHGRSVKLSPVSMQKLGFILDSLTPSMTSVY